MVVYYQKNKLKAHLGKGESGSGGIWSNSTKKTSFAEAGTSVFLKERISFIIEKGNLFFTNSIVKLLRCPRRGNSIPAITSVGVTGLTWQRGSTPLWRFPSFFFFFNIKFRKLLAFHAFFWFFVKGENKRSTDVQFFVHYSLVWNSPRWTCSERFSFHALKISTETRCQFLFQLRIRNNTLWYIIMIHYDTFQWYIMIIH